MPLDYFGPLCGWSSFAGECRLCGRRYVLARLPSSLPPFCTDGIPLSSRSFSVGPSVGSARPCPACPGRSSFSVLIPPPPQGEQANGESFPLPSRPSVSTPPPQPLSGTSYSGKRRTVSSLLILSERTGERAASEDGSPSLAHSLPSPLPTISFLPLPPRPRNPASLFPPFVLTCV